MERVKGKSYMAALTNVVNNLKANLDNNMISTLVLLDYSKTFDTVDYFIVLKKIFCFSETGYRLLRSNLTGRSQIVFYNGTYSESLDVNRFVPPTRLSAWTSIMLLIY